MHHHCILPRIKVSTTQIYPLLALVSKRLQCVVPLMHRDPPPRPGTIIDDVTVVRTIIRANDRHSPTPRHPSSDFQTHFNRVIPLISDRIAM
ncbi:hypothetical protein Y032_0007g3519 [Ancylostoma ceylanicum]|uniref:Uncharacterized protein n=1 Tax=Ancylostoma ceylanicum TaxID=53326 RepID=A0A016VNR0_9BILA|nr:hypothetical protein Y032_0007g3519 [Ancylostoma ceylanicum]